MKPDDHPLSLGMTLFSRSGLVCRVLAYGAIGASIGIANAATLPVEAELLEPEMAFSLTARMKNNAMLEVKYVIADGYYMYRDRFQFLINGEPVAKSRIRWPTGRVKQDATFGKVITYKKAFQVIIPLSDAQRHVLDTGGGVVMFAANSQGCADIGVCYPPLRQRVTLSDDARNWVAPMSKESAEFSVRKKSNAERLSDPLTEKSTSAK